MGKKKKKKKGGADASAAKQRPPKKEREDEAAVTMKEAMLAVQVKVKERNIEELNEEVEALEFKNDRQRDRNRKLKEEQQEHLSKLLTEYRARTDAERKEPSVETDLVDEALVDKFEANRDGQDRVEALHARVRALDAEIAEVTAELTWWQDFKDNTVPQNEARIKELTGQMKVPSEETKQLAAQIEEWLEYVREETQNRVEKFRVRRQESSKKMLYSSLPPDMREETDATENLREKVTRHEEYRERLVADIADLKARSLRLSEEVYDLVHVPATQLERYPHRIRVDDVLSPVHRDSPRTKATRPRERSATFPAPSAATMAVRGQLMSITEGKERTAEPDDDPYFPKIPGVSINPSVPGAELDIDEGTFARRGSVLEHTYSLPPITRDMAREMFGARSRTRSMAAATGTKLPEVRRAHQRTRTT